MNRKSIASPRRHTSGWATTALLTTAALVLAAGCGTRLSDDEIRAGGAGGSTPTGASASGSSTGGSGEAGSTGDGSTGNITNGDASSATTAGDSSATSSGSPTSSGSGPTSGSGSPTSGSGSPTSGSGSPTSGSPTSGSPTGSDPTTGGPPQQTGTPAILGGDASACKPATGSTVQLGNVSTTSGILGELFAPVIPALNLWVKSQNACGGLNGHVIKLTLGDDQGDPSSAVTVVNRQISTNKVIAFVGNIQVLTVDAITPIINKAKIPVIGSDITNDTWYTNPYFFPQGSPSQAVAYAYLDITKRVVKKNKVGHVYCLEVPVACLGINKAFGQLAPKLGVTNVLEKQASITAPSYTSQCLEAQKKGAEVLALTFEAASQGRLANSCAGLRPTYKPQYIAYPLGVGNERQFFGAGAVLGKTYVPLNTFGWMQNDTPATKYYQDSIKRFGFSGATGNAASLGWTAGALTVRAATKLGDTPTSEQLLEGLYAIKDETLGGLSSSKLTFKKVSSGGPAGAVQYCYYLVQSNDGNNGWLKPTRTPTCTSTRSAGDPNK